MSGMHLFRREEGKIFGSSIVSIDSPGDGVYYVKVAVTGADGILEYLPFLFVILEDFISLPVMKVTTDIIGYCY